MSSLKAVLVGTAFLQGMALMESELRRKVQPEQNATDAVSPGPVFCPGDETLRVTQAASSGPALCNVAARTGALQDIAHAFESTWSKQVARPFSEATAGTYLTIGDWRSGPFLGNWLAHAKVVTEVANKPRISVVNVALDEANNDACENFKAGMPQKGRLSLSCVSLSGWFPGTLFSPFAKKTGHDGCEAGLLQWAKPQILRSAVKASSFPVMLVDTDVVMYQDLLSLGAGLLAKSPAKKMVVGIEGSNGQANTGTVLATSASLTLLKQWATKSGQCLNSKEADKSALQHLAYYEEAKLEFFHSSDIGQCQRKGKAATHYNCVKPDMKAKTMKSMQNWAEGMSMNPEEVSKPGQHISITVDAKPVTKTAKRTGHA